MMKKIIIVLSVIIFLIAVLVSSKYIYFYYLEDIYYSTSYTKYDGVKEYVILSPEDKNINERIDIKYVDTIAGIVKFKYPYINEKPKIKIKKKDFLIYEKIDKSRKIVFVKKEDNLNYEIKRNIREIDSEVDTTNIFQVYNKIYSHIPKLNILMDSYENIKYDLRLTKLKSVLLPNGSDKNIYKFDLGTLKGFQFCNPDNCSDTVVSLFDDKKEYTLVFSNFTQNEIDFILSSIKIIDK